MNYPDVRIRWEEREKKIGAMCGMMLQGSFKRPSAAEMREAAGGVSVPPYSGVREAYVDFTGDHEFRGSIYTGDWAYIMSAAMNKVAVRDYGLLGLDTWKAFCQVVNFKNFHEQQFVRFGGYSNTPTVLEGGAYLPMTSPTDEVAKVTPTKKGGTEDITREMLINDETQSVQRIPQRLVRAGAQTIHEAVFDMIRPSVNPTIYDAALLYTTGGGSHLNLATSTLDATTLAAARVRMRNQTEKNSLKTLGIRGKWLIVPTDLEEQAYGLTRRAYGVFNDTPTFLQYNGLVPIVVPYWTDTNDWVLASDMADCIGLQIGFVNGQEVPEIFVSNMENVGSMFSNDKIIYKIRSEFGVVCTDYRAFQGNVVTGG
jgi:hypothetical protein